MSITTSKLRSDIYNLLDEILTTGKPLTIERKGQQLIIMPTKQPDKITRLTSHDCINGDPDEIIHNDWSKEWHCDLS